jgi:hypothetical protein
MINYWQILTTNFSDKGWSIEGNSYEGIKWSDESPKPTKEEFDILWESTQKSINATVYKAKRAIEYPAIGDQLDALFHAGVFPPEMAALIQAVKDKYPKEQS